MPRVESVRGAVVSPRFWVSSPAQPSAPSPDKPETETKVARLAAKVAAKRATAAAEEEARTQEGSNRREAEAVAAAELAPVEAEAGAEEATSALGALQALGPEADAAAGMRSLYSWPCEVPIG